MKGRRHILLLSMHYRPEPCDTRTSQLAKGLAGRGYQVTVLTTFPNYPLGKVYEGYRQRLFQIEMTDGVRLIRVPMIPDHSKSKLRRGLSYLSFGISAAFLGPLLVGKPDAVWVHHPPLTTGFAGWVISRVKRRPFVMEIHDLWPESLMSTGMVREGRITRWIRRACGFLHRRAAKLVVSSPGMAGHLAAQGQRPETIEVLPQWADEALFQPTSEGIAEIRRLQGMEGQFNVLFAGNLGTAQGLDAVLDAAKHLRSRTDIQIVFAGTGVEAERLMDRAERENLCNVRFLGHHPPEAMPGLMEASEATLVHLIDDPLFGITIPSKVQTYMAMGRPILCGVAGDAADVVRQAECGFCFPPEDSEAMAAAILELADLPIDSRKEMGRRARAGYLARFSQAALLNRYEALFGHEIGLRDQVHEVPAAAVVSATEFEAPVPAPSRSI